jgi:hypothetical protein
MVLMALEGAWIDPTMMVGERGIEDTSRAGQGMQVRDLGGIITRLGEGVLQTLDFEIRVVATRGGKISG